MSAAAAARRVRAIVQQMWGLPEQTLVEAWRTSLLPSGTDHALTDRLILAATGAFHDQLDLIERNLRERGVPEKQKGRDMPGLVLTCACLRFDDALSPHR